MKKTMVIMAAMILVSCASKSPNVLTQGPKMSDVLGGASDTSYRKEYKPAKIEDENNLDGYTRTAYNETNPLFPRLPNPEICMYIRPHLSQEDTPVPGYTSCTPMYEKNHYALPGEVHASD